MLINYFKRLHHHTLLILISVSPPLLPHILVRYNLISLKQISGHRFVLQPLMNSFEYIDAILRYLLLYLFVWRFSHIDILQSIGRLRQKILRISFIKTFLYIIKNAFDGVFPNKSGIFMYIRTKTPSRVYN